MRIDPVSFGLSISNQHHSNAKDLTTTSNSENTSKNHRSDTITVSEAIQKIQDHLSVLQQNDKLLSTIYSNAGNYFKYVGRYGSARDSYYIAYNYDPSNSSIINEIRYLSLKV